MRVSSKLQVEGVRIVSEIGRIEAASDWRAGSSSSEESMQRALEKLKQLAAEFEADAIVGVDYSVDAVQTFDLAPVPMKRVSVSGVAVKLARD